MNGLKNLAENDVSCFLFRFEIHGNGISFVINQGIGEDMYPDIDDKMKPLAHVCCEALSRYRLLSVSNTIMDGNLLDTGEFEVMLSRGLGKYFPEPEKQQLFQDAKKLADLLIEVMERRTKEEKERKPKSPPYKQYPQDITEINPQSGNGICMCTQEDTCQECLFWEKHNTPAGRKALCEKIVNFLTQKPFYQQIISQTVNKLFPEKVIFNDQKDICRMLFEAAIFEDISMGKTPFAYFLQTASLSPQEKQLYKTWQRHTCFGFFIVDNVIPEKEIHLTDLSGKKHYRVYETRGTQWMQKGKVIMCRIVPFLKGWMITTETIVSYSNITNSFKQKAADAQISQFIAVKKHHEDRERRMKKLTNKHLQLARDIDEWAQSIEQEGGGDAEIFQNSYSHLPVFRELLDTTTSEQMDFLCETCPGFYRFAKLVESVAQGLHDGTIKAPTVN